MEITSNSWAALCHLAALLKFLGIPFGNILGPLVIWLVKKGDSPFIDEHGKESLNFQISMTLYIAFAFIGLVVFLLTSGLGLSIMMSSPWVFIMSIISVALLPVLMIGALLFLDFVLIVIGAVKAANGESYRYPLVIRFIS